MKLSPSFFPVFGLFCTLSLLLPQVVFSQDFSSLNEDLSALKKARVLEDFYTDSPSGGGSPSLAGAWSGL
jgi:hypothetical protein